jgi:hypothetical protein
MTIRHGTRYRYSKGCRCNDCAEAARIYQLRTGGPVVADDITESGNSSSPGAVEQGVLAETDGLAAQARPGLAQAALAVARVLDNPRAVNQHTAAAKVLSVLLDKLRAVSARGRRGGLRVVREMTGKKTATDLHSRKCSPPVAEERKATAIKDRDETGRAIPTGGNFHTKLMLLPSSLRRCVGWKVFTNGHPVADQTGCRSCWSGIVVDRWGQRRVRRSRSWSGRQHNLQLLAAHGGAQRARSGSCRGIRQFADGAVLVAFIPRLAAGSAPADAPGGAGHARD